MLVSEIVSCPWAKLGLWSPLPFMVLGLEWLSQNWVKRHFAGHTWWNFMIFMAKPWYISQPLPSTNPLKSIENTNQTWFQHYFFFHDDVFLSLQKDCRMIPFLTHRRTSWASWPTPMLLRWNWPWPPWTLRGKLRPKRRCRRWERMDRPICGRRMAGTGEFLG